LSARTEENHQGPVRIICVKTEVITEHQQKCRQ